MFLSKHLFRISSRRSSSSSNRGRISAQRTTTQSHTPLKPMFPQHHMSQRKNHTINELLELAILGPNHKMWSTITEKHVPVQVESEPREVISDPSAEISLQTPAGHFEDKNEAHRLNFNRVYVKKDILGKHNESLYTMGFNRKDNIGDISSFVNFKKQNFFANTPNGQVSNVKLHPSTTEHIPHDKPFAAVLYDSSPQNRPRAQRVGQLSFYIETPKGFWEMNWYASMENVVSPDQQAQFIDTVKSLSVTPKTDAENQNKKQEQQQQKPIKKQQQKKKKKKKTDEEKDDGVTAELVE